MRGNTIRMNLQQGTIAKGSESLYQYDYGQTLILTGVTLPDSYEVHFSNSNNGTSKTSIGNANGVLIPDEFLITGDPIYIWIFMHAGEDDGETEFKGVINVYKRAKPTDEQPTPEQQSVITQTIATLNRAVAKCEANVEHYPKVVDGYWYVWDAEQETWVNTGDQAQGEQGETGATPNFSIGTVTTVSPDTPASATITGTPENPVLNLSLPKGDDGDISSSDVATTEQTQVIIDEYGR